MQALAVPAFIASEENVIGSILLAREDALLQVIDFLKPEHFYRERNAQAFRAMLTLFKRGQPIDLISVTRELETLDHGTGVNLAELLDSTPTVYHVIHHAHEVVRAANCRRVLQLAGKMAREFHEVPQNVEALIGAMASELLGVVDQTKRNSPLMRDILFDLKGRDRSRIMSTEMPTLNTYTGGLEPGHLWAVGGFSSTGKTAFALQLLLDAITKGRRVAYFSLEMMRQQLALRLLANISGLPIWRIDTDDPHPQERDDIRAAENWLANKPGLWIYDDVYELSEIAYLCRRHKLQNGLDVVFIDFLQNLRGGSDEYERLSDGIKVIQQLAKQIECTFIVLSQISNEQAATGMGSQDAYSFKGSGAIRDAADKALMLVRDRQGDSTREIGDMKLIVKKNRQGPIGEVRLRFEFATGRIGEVK